MPTATVFLNNRSQAIRLPKAVAFPPDVRRVAVRVDGNSLIISPLVESWQAWGRARQVRDPGFMASRDQGAFDQRDWAA